jgi:hypothetical protein
VSWRGLELAVTMVVHNSGRLNVPYFSITGVADPSKDRIVQTPTLRFVETPPVRTYPQIAAGEFVCCWRNHAVIDMFAYSANGAKFFIQVSLSPYREHNTRLPHLFTHQIAFPAGYDTVYDFYSRCTDSSFQIGQNPTALRTNEFYVYITSSTQAARQASLTTQEKAVYCVAGDQLHQVLGDSLAEAFFTSKKRRSR